MSDESALPKKEREQHQTMFTRVWTDQHGRRWAGTTDKDSGTPLSLRPWGWAPPLPAMTPPAKYHQYEVESQSFTIDYKGWLDEYAEAERDFQQWQLQVAKRFYGAAALEKIKANDSELRRETGEPPQSTLFIRAMASGNKWALGLPRPDGTPYPRPSWADEAMDSWQITYTLRDDGSFDFGAEAFPDVEDEPVGVGASRPDWLGDDVFADEEPVTTRRGRKGAA